MVMREGEDYTYLGVSISNLGIVRKRGEGRGVDEIIRKAQVHTAIVRDEIRDSYDKIHEGKTRVAGVEIEQGEEEEEGLVVVVSGDEGERRPGVGGGGKFISGYKWR